MNDKVNHPTHYTSHPSGVECIQITECYNFCVGNAIKYIWRAGLKDEAEYDPVEKEIEDCQKAIWYLTRHIDRLKKSVPVVGLTNKQKVDRLNTLMKPKASEQVFTIPSTREITEQEKKLIRDLAVEQIKPGTIKAGGAEMLDREMVARASVSYDSAQKTWLDCND